MGRPSVRAQGRRSAEFDPAERAASQARLELSKALGACRRALRWLDEQDAAGAAPPGLAGEHRRLASDLAATAQLLAERTS